MYPQLTISNRHTEYKDLEARVDALKAAQDQMLRQVLQRLQMLNAAGILLGFTVNRIIGVYATPYDYPTQIQGTMRIHLLHSI